MMAHGAQRGTETAAPRGDEVFLGQSVCQWVLSALFRCALNLKSHGGRHAGGPPQRSLLD
jgi:hypothetical protein